MFSYDIKVRREKTYLFGGAGIRKNFASDFFLVCRVDDFGERIELTSEERTNNDATPFGTLDPGESYVLPLREVAGVFARTTTGQVDSTVRCTLIAPVRAS